MSGQPPSNAGSSAPRTTGNNAVNGSMPMSAQPRSNESGLGNNSGSGNQGGTISQQNLNQIVSQKYVTCQAALYTLVSVGKTGTYMCFLLVSFVCESLRSMNKDVSWARHKFSFRARRGRLDALRPCLLLEDRRNLRLNLSPSPSQITREALVAVTSSAVCIYFTRQILLAHVILITTPRSNIRP